MLIDVAIPGDKNVSENEAEKILKYKDPVLEIQRTWNVKAKVVPVKTRATRTISQSLRQYLSNIPGKHEIKELKKKSAILGTAHTAESATVMVQNTFQGRNNITCSAKCKYRAAAMLRDLQT